MADLGETLRSSRPTRRSAQPRGFSLILQRAGSRYRLPIYVLENGTADPTGFDVVVNASPVGMREGDPLPVEVARLTPAMFVGCVITAPAVTPLIAAARERGCGTVTGSEMFARVRDLMVDFLLEQPA